MIYRTVALALLVACGPAGADIADPDTFVDDTGDTSIGDTSIDDTVDTSIDNTVDTAIDDTAIDDTSVEDTDSDTSVDTAEVLEGITHLSAPGPLDMDAWEGTAYPETVRGHATGVDWACDHPLVHVRGLVASLDGTDDFEVVMHTWDNERDGGEMGSLIVVHCEVTSDQGVGAGAFAVNAWRVTP